MIEKRKQYSKAFKLDAISLVLDQSFSRKEAAASLEINAQDAGAAGLRNPGLAKMDRPFVVMAN